MQRPAFQRTGMQRVSGKSMLQQGGRWAIALAQAMNSERTDSALKHEPLLLLRGAPAHWHTQYLAFTADAYFSLCLPLICCAT